MLHTHIKVLYMYTRSVTHILKVLHIQSVINTDMKGVTHKRCHIYTHTYKVLRACKGSVSHNVLYTHIK